MKSVPIGSTTLAALVALGAGPAGAADFLETYRLARQNDSQFASARAQVEAGMERIVQGRALLLPIVEATGNYDWRDVTTKTKDSQEDTVPRSSGDWTAYGWRIQLTQPLFRWANLIQYQQSKYQVQQAEAQFGQATQDLVVRVAQAYFDVLTAQDSLESIRANKVAIAEQLAQAKRNFEVGTATITDTNEAQARYDLAVSQEIAGQNQLEVAQRALQQIIGAPPTPLTPLRSKVTIQPPQPNKMEDWVASARGNNFVVKANEALFEIATKDIERNRAGHYPNLDVVASYDGNTGQQLSLLANTAPTRTTTNQGIIGLQLNVPIYSGGAVSSRTREAVSLRERARQDLETSRRTAEFNASQSFLNVTNGMARVKALEQALVSSETALQSNRVGYEVGVRINIDVLNAQQQVYQTKRDLSQARYETIVNGLRLKAAAGSLTETDVEDVNRLLGAP